MSRTITVSLPHDLGRAEARARIETGFGDLGRHLGTGAGVMTRAWQGDRMSFALNAMGQAISGAVEVADRIVTVQVALPSVLALMAGALRGRLQREGQLLLEKK